MPSKLQHEIDKLRGEVSATGKVYTSSIAALQDALTAAETSIKELESADDGFLSKINAAKQLSSKSVSLANTKVPKEGGRVMSGNLLPAKDELYSIGAINDKFYLAYVKELYASSKVCTDIINEQSLNSGVTIDGILCKDNILLVGSGFRISASQINRIDSDTDDASMAFNYNGYQNGVTRFRDTVIYNGKHAAIIFVDGSSKEATFNGDIITAHNVDGRDLSVDGTKLDTIDTNADVTDATNVNAAGAVMESDFNGSHVYFGTTGSTQNPVAIGIGANQICGRLAGGLTNLTATNVRGILNVANGADVTGSNAPQAHGASVHTDRTRKMFIAVPSHKTAGSSAYSAVSFDAAADEEAYYHFKLPTDFVSLTSIKVIWLPMFGVGLPKNWVLDVTTTYAALTENDNNHTGSDTANVIEINSGNILDYTAFTVDVGVLTGVTKDDYIKIKLLRDADNGSDDYAEDIHVIGIEIEYTADM